MKEQLLAGHGSLRNDNGNVRERLQRSVCEWDEAAERGKRVLAVGVRHIQVSVVECPAGYKEPRSLRRVRAKSKAHPAARVFPAQTRRGSPGSEMGFVRCRGDVFDRRRVIFVFYKVVERDLSAPNRDFVSGLNDIRLELR